MLPARYRLSGKENFAIIKNKGKVSNSASYSMLYLNNNLGKLRIGVVVSTRVAKNASLRNRVKRILKECLRYEVKNITPSYDLLFLTKRSILGKEKEVLRKEIQLSLQKENLTI